MKKTIFFKGSNKGAGILACSVLCFLCIFFISPSFAKENLNSISNKIDKTKSYRGKQTKKQKALEDQVIKSEKEISRATNLIRKARKSIDNEKKSFATLIEQMKFLTKEKLIQQKLLERQLVSAYVTGDHNLFKLLLNQDDLSKMVRANSYYQYLNKARLESIESLHSTQMKLEKNKIEQTKTLVSLQKLYKEQTNRKAKLTSERVIRKIALKKLKKDLDYQNILLAELGDIQKELKIKLEAIQAMQAREKHFKNGKVISNISKNKGKLNWPINGRILNKFHAKRSIQVEWKGITISANEGEKVRAVSVGRVLFAGYFKGYGMVVALDHGNNYITLYGNNQTILQKQGDIVLEGDEIALAGHSGGQDKNSLYFELRYKGKAQDPLRWLKRRK